MSGDLLQKRIHRVLAIAQAFGYSMLVLGAWGWFGNDPHRPPSIFLALLRTSFAGHSRRSSSRSPLVAGKEISRPFPRCLLITCLTRSKGFTAKDPYFFFG